MFDTNELNDKLVSELRDIARMLGIAEAEDLRKAHLISRIVEQEQLIEAARTQQSTVNTIYTPKGAAPSENTEKTRKRIRVKKQQYPAC
jgi:transcription termination factor Rho